jgi:very-short-patch-repair endonuclease
METTTDYTEKNIIEHLANMRPGQKRLGEVFLELKVFAKPEWFIKPYYADWFLPDFSVIFEADGKQHLTNDEYDDWRSNSLLKLGIDVYRQQNTFILNDKKCKEWVVKSLLESDIHERDDRNAIQKKIEDFNKMPF